MFFDFILLRKVYIQNIGGWRNISHQNSIICWVVVVHMNPLQLIWRKSMENQWISRQKYSYFP